MLTLLSLRLCIVCSRDNGFKVYRLSDSDSSSSSDDDDNDESGSSSSSNESDSSAPGNQAQVTPLSASTQAAGYQEEVEEEDQALKQGVRFKLCRLPDSSSDDDDRSTQTAGYQEVVANNYVIYTYTCIGLIRHTTC